MQVKSKKSIINKIEELSNKYDNYYLCLSSKEYYRENKTKIDFLISMMREEKAYDKGSLMFVDMNNAETKSEIKEVFGEYANANLLMRLKSTEILDAVALSGGN